MPRYRLQTPIKPIRVVAGLGAAPFNNILFLMRQNKTACHQFAAALHLPNKGYNAIRWGKRK